MKTKLALIFGITLLTASAHAGLFSFLAPRPDLPAYFKKIVPEVPVNSDCETTYALGDGGLFRQTEYCHKTNPAQPRGFLEQGYDVPASFLSGFTEAETLARWGHIQVPAPAFMGSKIEVPTELFTSLNMSAAQAWEKIMACANGDADRAREMYRIGSFGCAEESSIRARLQDIRSSLASLATSAELAVFLDESRIEQKRREFSEKLRELPARTESMNPQQSREAYEEILHQDSQYFDYRRRNLDESLPELFKRLLPRLPQMHPLLTQIMTEELLSLIRPSESSWLTSSRFKKNPQERNLMLQLLVWSTSVEDRACDTAGLWPSANRVAMEAIIDKASEYVKFLRPNNFFALDLMIVTCPKGKSKPERPSQERSAIELPQTWLAQDVMRLGDIYKDGRQTVWSELLDVRERYVGR